MILRSGSNKTVFKKSGLRFIESGITNVFRKKCNKTVRQTIQHRRYQSLAFDCQTRYGAELEKPLGEFLYDLKLNGDNFYRRFLNKYGDLEYCHFRLSDAKIAAQKGLYAYAIQERIMYLGRTKDPYKKRVDQGYGKIHPKNCYLDGQSTNCHKNFLISKSAREVEFWVAILEDDDEIERTESNLIRHYTPPWNLQLGT